ncbi:MAG: ABC transporter permease [Candidatus Pristimantibacillus lignocellulolyticus]|uniref:ABC transporter permease n=1 Tax=Candidatus Pristimantibacillus lignocellulolyticus TaxID=2994561 RepID=A0A9J6ZJN4_9BACL|nr:MAG: ABC transporter permease [Candidatus Pristimantibacillus lignocellulolyticus]
MGRLLLAEWYKLRKTNIIPFILIGPALVLAIACNVELDMEGTENFQYIYTSMMVNLVYAVMFLPLMTGVLATIICRYEHQAGGWKQLFALPTTRGKVYVSKFVIIISITLIMQLLYALVLLSVGLMKGYGEPFPMVLIVKSIFGGWVATLPLIALQLWLSTLFKSFAAPFAVNVIFTIPTILVMNSAKVAPYYPWAQPFAMMYIAEDKQDVFFIPWEQLLTVVGGSFILFFVLGYIYLQRKEV